MRASCSDSLFGEDFVKLWYLYDGNLCMSFLIRVRFLDDKLKIQVVQNTCIYSLGDILFNLDTSSYSLFC